MAASARRQPAGGSREAIPGASVVQTRGPSPGLASSSSAERSVAADLRPRRNGGEFDRDKDPLQLSPYTPPIQISLNTSSSQSSTLPSPTPPPSSSPVLKICSWECPPLPEKLEGELLVDLVGTLLSLELDVLVILGVSNPGWTYTAAQIEEATGLAYLGVRYTTFSPDALGKAVFIRRSRVVLDFMEQRWTVEGEKYNCVIEPSDLISFTVFPPPGDEEGIKRDVSIAMTFVRFPEDGLAKIQATNWLKTHSFDLGELIMGNFASASDFEATPYHILTEPAPDEETVLLSLSSFGGGDGPFQAFTTITHLELIQGCYPVSICSLPGLVVEVIPNNAARIGGLFGAM